MTVFFLTTLVGVKGNILCLEADGCVELEVVQNNSCCSSPVRASQTNAHASQKINDLAHENHCDSCMDIPLWIEGGDQYIVTDNSRALENQAVVLTALSYLPSTFNLTVTGKSLKNSSPQIDISLLSHQTTILLI